jgi:hypothetical protein
MPTYFIIPPRKVVGSGSSVDVVTSLNTLKGNLLLASGTGLTLTTLGSTFTLSVTPNTYVLRTGDTVVGNVQFTPSGGGYGLRLHTSSSDPVQNATGAVYYNTSTNTVRVHDGSWQDLGQMGALTESSADSLYLRLDGTNDSSISGDIDFQSVVLRLGRKNSDPGTGHSGDFYFNTISNTARIYDGTAWRTLDGTVKSVGGAAGIITDLIGNAPIISNGSLQLDLAYSPTWTGTHTHTQSIVFASSQNFNITKLTIGSQTNGDLIRFNSGWERLGIGSSGHILTVVGGLPAWAAPASGGTIGAPTDGVYTDGFFDTWTTSTSIGDAVDDLNELVKDIAPSQAVALTGLDLSISSPPTFHTVKISDGIPSLWYYGGASAGSTITTYYTSGDINLLTPSISDTFRCGLKSDSNTFGTVYHKLYNPAGNSDIYSFDLTPGVTGTSGDLTITSLATYNNIWKKANASISYTQVADGYEGHSIRHVSSPSTYSAGESNVYKVWLDTYSALNPSPAFSSGPTATEVTPVDKYLSGINYYGANSTFNVSFVAASGIFNKCYNASQVARISSEGMNNLNLNPASTPTYTDTFDKSGGNVVLVTLNAANEKTMNTYLTVTLYKASGVTTSDTADISRAICTYGTASTTTSDIFVDEAQRLELDTLTSWTSSDTLLNGNAQVRNGVLQYPDSTDYPGFTGDQEYQRLFSKTSASTGTLTFNSGFDIADISPYGSGDLNILIYLDDDSVYFDLGIPAGLGVDGSSKADAFGGKNIGSSGNTLNWSIGTYTTGPTGSGNLGKYRIMIIFRNDNNQITSITAS